MPELIFFDTFSHDGIDSIAANMDLVQFPSPVRVTEIRIIPLGARVEAKFPNGDRLGATNPSSFEVSFYVNDLSSPGASTFANIGNLSYRQNVSIVLTPRIVVPTDGLLIKGDYQTLTIAVLGETKDIPSIKTEQMTSEEPNVAQISSENQGVILSPSQITQEPQSPTATDEASQGAFSERSPSDRASITGPAGESFVERESTQSDIRCPSLDDLSSPSRLSPSSVTRSSLPSPSPFPTDGEDSNLVRKDYEKEKDPLPPPVNPDLLESISPDASPVPGEDTLDAEAISDDELPELPPNEEAEEALEDISSDDDVGGNEEKMEEGEGFIDSVVDDAPHHLIFFDPSKDSIEGLDSAFDPCLVTASLDQEEAMTALRYLGEFIDDRDKFLSSLTKFVTVRNQETREEENAYIIPTVIQILDSIISTKLRGRTVRQTKGILTLVRILLSGPWNLRIKLLEEKVVSRLIALFDKDFVVKPPSLRLRILDCLDVIMDFNYGMEFCLLKPHSAETNQTIYQWTLEKIMEKPSTRVLVGLTALLKKCHFFESLTLLSRLSDESTPGTEEVKALLSQITFKTHHAHKFMHQPLRLLPASSIWERKYDDLVDTTLFKWSQGCHVLPACLKILKNESLKESHSLVLELVERISQLREGSIFLLTGSRISDINEIIQITLAHQNSRLHSLASSIAWKLHAISLICHLNQLSKREHGPRMDNSFEQKVYRLFMLLFTNEGKTALFQAASDDSILRMLIQIPTLRRAQEVKIVQDSLVQVIVQAVLSRQDPVHMFKLCGSRLSRISRDSNNPLLAQFIDTVTPISRVDFTSPDYFALLCRTLRREFDIIKDSSHSSSIQLLTLTRVMREVSHDPPVDHEKLGDPRELKYDFALFHLYSNNGLEQLFSVIDHISKNYCNPYLRLFQSQESKFITVESLASSISIIHSILKKLISLRGANFSDISGVPVLLRSLAIDDSFFDDAFLKVRIQKVKDQILETLHLYTRFTWNASPNSQSSGIVEAGKSLWVKMLRELLSLTISSPNWFTAGLCALDFLLPEPLPILIGSEEKQKEAEKLLTMRRIWSAHLQHVSEGIENLVASLCCSSTPEVVSGLRRICIKLSELPVTPGVSCCMGFLKVWPSIKDKLAELLNWLHLVSSLISHPSFRITFLFTLFHSNKEVYEGIIPSIFDLLNNTNEDVVIRTADILTKLCDPRIQIEKKSSCSDSERKLQDLADTLPPLHFLKRVAIGLQPTSWDQEERPRDFLCAPKTEKVTASWTQLSNVLIVVLEALVSSEPHGVISAELTKKSQLFAEVSDVESLLPRPRPLAVIFEDRLVIKVLTKTDETEEVLLTTPISGQRTDIDLLPIANSINGFTLSRELESFLSDELHGTKRKRSDLDNSAGHHHQQPFNSKRLATPVVRTVRGRGISTGMPLGSRANDPFRSRPPNTSRPPSMHVDDFVALEHRDSGVKGKHQPKRLGGTPIAPQPNPKNWTRLRRT